MRTRSAGRAGPATHVPQANHRHPYGNSTRPPDGEFDLIVSMASHRRDIALTPSRHPYTAAYPQLVHRNSNCCREHIAGVAITHHGPINQDISPESPAGVMHDLSGTRYDVPDSYPAGYMGTRVA
ncbi:hypothetical protein GCM10012286_68230 [Streptomyces lasiicapitis]|uniref:Uncharacterized protein n=1 Tax=Streptomyces lasiicapitis TaxID=1923961 RepID=A0ABQ2MPR5_9ACTN|nr:hypothetical protein GCM10012286_68230 [Streptomyces lasiicapitis]